MSILYNKKIKYIVLILITFFLVFSIYYFKEHVVNVGISYDNMDSDKMTGEEEFLLHVNEPTTIYLLHDAKMNSGEIKFKLTNEKDKMIDEYKLTSNALINKSYKLEKGSYSFNIIRSVTNDNESFILYYDKRYAIKENIKDDSVTRTSD